MKKFGQRLKIARQKVGLTRNALAQRMGEKAETLRRIEAGITRSPRLVLAQKLATELGVSLDYLISDDPEKKYPLPLPSSKALQPSIRQVSSGKLEIRLPYGVRLTRQHCDELAKRLALEIELICQRQRVSSRK